MSPLNLAVGSALVLGVITTATLFMVIRQPEPLSAPAAPAPAMAVSPQPEVEGPLDTVVYRVEGMTCINCVRAVQRTLQTVAGVASVEVSLAEGTATIQHAAATPITAEQCNAALAAAGKNYPVSQPPGGGAPPTPAGPAPVDGQTPAPAAAEQ